MCDFFGLAQRTSMTTDARWVVGAAIMVGAKENEALERASMTE